MSKALANLLDKPQDLIENMIKKLEDLNGAPSEDVRLLAENLQKLRVKLSQLGLDPDDTTGEELYQSLRSKFDSDAAQIEQALGVNPSASLSKRASKAAELIAGIGELPEMWLLKHSAAKDLLRQMPPKKLMKKLNYHSAQSMLKRENVDNIFLVAAQLESGSWCSALNKKIAKLSSASFEMRRLSITSLPEKYVTDPTSPKSYMVTDTNLGAVALWPVNISKDAGVLSLAALLLSRLEKLSGKELSAKFYELSPTLRWWAGNSNLVSNHDTEVVSLNLKDIASDVLENHDYSNRTRRHGTNALFKELVGRYQKQSANLANSLKALGYNLSAEVSSQKAPFGAQLAAEYAGVE